MKNIAVVLAAGQGKRMQSGVQKQYLPLGGKPVICHCLQTFEEAPEIQEIVLVVGAGECEDCKKQIVDAYGFSKVKAIVEGGRERYDSVLRGLRAIADCDYVYIHDGARPFVTKETISRLQRTVEQTGACVAAAPAKDTIKLADSNGMVTQTPDRGRVWIAQTPQVFSFPLVRDAYERYLAQPNPAATDDAMVVEQMTGHGVQLVESGYDNIKLTTPEDLRIAEALLQK